MELWEVYIDETTGRKFFVHSITKDKTWKPPRIVQPNKEIKESTMDVQSALTKLSSPRQNPGAVQMRIKSIAANCDRLSQTKSMVLTDPGHPAKAISRHRRNHSQHNLGDVIAGEKPDIEKSEYLNKAKIADGGKKLRKNWAPTWVVLDGKKLLFYKESKQQALTNLKTGCKPESVDLYGAQIEWTTEKSSRKNVFQITTGSGSEFLLQSEKHASIFSWHDAIKNAIDSLGTDGRLVHSNIRKSSSTDLVNRCGESSPAVKETKPEHRRSLMFKLTYSASDSGDKHGVKNRLKKFISRRPSMKTLQEKGIIRDQVFGCHLATLCKREETTIPNFVRQCLKNVEERGLETDGIYRVSGNLATIQKLRFVVDQEEKLNLDDSQWEDIHVVTGALKMFFRELPEPLFPFCFFELFVEAIKTQDYRQRVQSIKKLVSQLPKPNHDTMKALFRHFQNEPYGKGHLGLLLKVYKRCPGPPLCQHE
ncbi:rho GTPase-activating protein 15-like isoform X3 [Polyodon spathula]|uniref:rho GTPase-activating protein 15-like isoform X3 n=1 Tax=Polyodon spathula TaxID=7913 RepID=UPI001B7D9B1B|nr:rho GTPase-activating protein 15-like isoform X3 [Polyodon spathula]XP_041118056.1 rho GTPase-activating protein 15-like isoform X3 [Polyodon spathula]